MVNIIGGYDADAVAAKSKKMAVGKRKAIVKVEKLKEGLRDFIESKRCAGPAEQHYLRREENRDEREISQQSG